MREKITDFVKEGTWRIRSFFGRSRIQSIRSFFGGDRTRRIRSFFGERRNRRIVCIAGIVVLAVVIMGISGIPHYVTAVALERICGLSGNAGVTDGLTPSDDNPINSEILHLHRTRHYAKYDRELLEDTANSLSSDYTYTNYTGYYVESFTYGGNTYYVNGLMEETTYLSEEIGQVPDAEMIRCEEGAGNNTVADIGTTLHLYQVGEIDLEMALAVWFEEGDGFYYYMNAGYTMKDWTLTEILEACGFTENSDVYVWLYPHSRAFNIYYIDVPGEYLCDEVISKADTTCSEYTGDKTGIVVYLTSEITGASVWLRFLESGGIVLCDIYSGFQKDYTCGVPYECQNRVFDLEDEQLEVGEGLLNYLAENCEGMIRREWWH